MSSLALLLRFCEEQVQYRRSERRHLEFVFPLFRFVPGYRLLELLDRIIFDNMFR